MNKVNLKYKYFLGICLLLMLLLGSTVSASSNTTDTKEDKIKVFFPLQPGLAYLDETGRPAGYTYDYLMKVAQRTGWEYEFVVVDYTDENIAKGIEDLKSGKIDILSMAFIDEKTAEFLEYTMLPYGQINYSFMGLPDNKELNNRTVVDMLDSLTIAINESDPATNQVFENFASSYPLVSEIVYAPTYEACIELLETGNADFMLSRSTLNTPELKPILVFDMEYFHFATSKDNTELMQTLNSAIGEIESLPDVFYRVELQDKHFPPYQQPYLSLTPSEAEYIAAAPTLRVGILDNKAPISDFNSETGNFEGIVIDLMNSFQSRSGLKFTYVNVTNQAELSQLILDGEIDLIAGFPEDYQLAQKSNLLLTGSLLTSPVVRISSKSKNIKNPETLASLSLKSFYNTNDYKYVESADEIFAKLNSGEYGTAFVNGYIAQGLMGYRSYGNLVMTSTPSSTYELCIAVSKDLDLRLMAILEQAISQMPTAQKEEIIYRNTNIFPEINLWELIQNDPSTITFPIIIVFLIIIALLLLLIYKSKRLNRMIANERSRYKEKSDFDQMTGAYNNLTFKTLAKDYLACTDPIPQGALIICDVDDFKNVNDSYGHLFGDVTLTKIATQLKESFPGSSIVGRIGGDEFAILIREPIREQELSLMCTKLLEECTSFDPDRPVTLSLGSTIFNQNIAFEELFQYADNTLYEVKEAGKNNFKVSGVQ